MPGLPDPGPGLRRDAEGVCAFEDHGRFRTRRCRANRLTHEVVDPLGDVALVCAPHAEAWGRELVVRVGIDEVRERVVPC